jgi:molybdopterin-guanine dinucleotide biosynthesis protein
MRSVKVAVSGAHSTGKTTFLQRTAEILNDNGISSHIVTDLAIKCPLPILRQHTVESTLWLVSTGLAEEIAAAHKSNVVLVDRPVLDAWAYWMAVLPNVETASVTPKFKTLESTIKNWLPTYDLIYQTQIDGSIPVEDNKGRELDESYRLEIGRQMKLASKEFKVKPRILTSTNAQREIEWLVNYVKGVLSGS